jgi:hypothetical protein
MVGIRKAVRSRISDRGIACGVYRMMIMNSSRQEWSRCLRNCLFETEIFYQIMQRTNIQSDRSNEGSIAMHVGSWLSPRDKVWDEGKPKASRSLAVHTSSKLKMIMTSEVPHSHASVATCRGTWVVPLFPSYCSVAQKYYIAIRIPFLIEESINYPKRPHSSFKIHPQRPSPHDRVNLTEEEAHGLNPQNVCHVFQMKCGVHIELPIQQFHIGRFGGQLRNISKLSVLCGFTADATESQRLIMDGEIIKRVDYSRTNLCHHSLRNHAST